MSVLSKILIKKPAVEGSHTDHIMIQEVSEKAATSFLFSKRVKTTLGVFFLFTMGAWTVDDIDTQEEDDDSEEADDFESH